MTEAQTTRHHSQQNTQKASGAPFADADPKDEIDIGKRVRQLRTGKGFSLRGLAEASRLNVNTLSLIENGRTSPNVSTLQQLAIALKIPLTAFFEAELPEKHIVFQKAGRRPRAAFSNGTMEDLGAGLTLHGGKPLLVILEPHANCGPTQIVHTGREFVYCLDGQLTYIVEEREYKLEAGDSLIFEAHLPHYWENAGATLSRSILIICPEDEDDRSTEKHFA